MLSPEKIQRDEKRVAKEQDRKRIKWSLETEKGKEGVKREPADH
jgi:hypothetical protein